MLRKIIDFLHWLVDRDYVKNRNRKFYKRLYEQFRKRIGCPGPYVVDDVPWILYINQVNLDVFFHGCTYLCVNLIAHCYNIPYSTAEELFLDCVNHVVFMRPKSTTEWQDEDVVAEIVQHLIIADCLYHESDESPYSGVKMMNIVDVLYAFDALSYYKYHKENKDYENSRNSEIHTD